MNQSSELQTADNSDSGWGEFDEAERLMRLTEFEDQLWIGFSNRFLPGVAQASADARSGHLSSLSVLHSFQAATVPPLWRVENCFKPVREELS